MKRNLPFYLPATGNKILYAFIMLLIPYMEAFSQDKIGVIKLSPQHFQGRS
jgi:hypothetical protein